MKPIPQSVKKQILADRFYDKCANCGQPGVEWHHALKYGGSSIQQKWAIVPACHSCHLEVDTKPETKAFFQYVAYRRMDSAAKLRYYKMHWREEMTRITNGWPQIFIKYNRLCNLQ